MNHLLFFDENIWYLAILINLFVWVHECTLLTETFWVQIHFFITHEYFFTIIIIVNNTGALVGENKKL